MLPLLPQTMSSTWMCGLLFLGSLFLLDQATQGTAQFFELPKNSLNSLAMLRPLSGAQIYDMIRRQAIKVHQLAVEHLNKKYNTTYRKAPKETTHIMVEQRSIRCYHINTVLVNAKCPENHTEGDLKDCEIPPDAPKLECVIFVIELFGSDYLYIEKGCHEYKPPPASTGMSDNLSEEKQEIAYQ